MWKIVLILLFLSLSSKAQLFNKYVYVRLVHNQQVVQLQRDLWAYRKGDTINISGNSKTWFICHKHRLDTTAIVNGIRYECHRGIVLSKKEAKLSNPLKLPQTTQYWKYY